MLFSLNNYLKTVFVYNFTMLFASFKFQMRLQRVKHAKFENLYKRVENLKTIEKASCWLK